MSNVITFKVYIEGLENKIWRKIEITDIRTIADLAYTILASFDSLAYHLYNIKYNNKIFISNLLDEEWYRYGELYDATSTKINELFLNINDKMLMEYDYGSSTYFYIEYISNRPLEKHKGRHYPYVIDGKGRGMMEDISCYELQDIVKDIDKKGYSIHDFTPAYERPIKYDYRDFDIESNNILLKGLIEEIKYSYEGIE